MNFISDNSSQPSANTQSTSLSDNLVYISLLASSNTTLNTTITTSNTNTSNYASNISNVLLTAISTNSGTSNYASNISNVLLTAISTNSGTSNYASNISNVLLSNSDATYLKLAGGTMTSQLQISAATSNGLYISNTNTNDVVSINLKNNSTYNGYIGIGCTGYNGNYINNLYIQSPQSFIINTNGNVSSATPNMIINTSGNIGIGTTNPGNILQVGNAGRLRISNTTDDYTLIGTKDVDGNTNTRIIINGNTRASSPGNISYVATNTGSHIFYTTNSPVSRMLINSSGNVGIGTTNPVNILQVGGAGRLKIGSGITDYTIIGTQDIDDNTSNTKIFINGMGNTSAGAAGCIQYFATSATGAHVYYGGSPLSEIARLTAAGNLNTIGTITGTTITGTTINATGNLQESGVNLSTKYATKATDIVNTSNYASNISNVLLTAISTNSGTSNYASNISNVLLANTNATYLKLAGGTMSGQLQISAATSNGLYITNTNTNDVVSINLKNNSTYNGFIGIGCTAYGGNYANNLYIQSPQSFIINTNGNVSSATPNMIINTTGNVGIGTTNPNQKLHIDSGCLYITNNILTPGNNTSASFWNQSGIGPTISGNAFVVQTNGTTERLRIDNAGLLSTTGNIDCGGGIAITGSTAFYSATSIDAANLTNTYLNLKDAGANSDWCYLRQIGGVNTYKLAFDFHDDIDDARFCIRKIQSTNTPDTILEVFTIDNGNTTMTGTCTATSFVGSGTSLTNIPYSSLTGIPVIYTQAQTDTVILTAQTNNSNYASNISNVLLTAISTNSGSGTSNYASNISNFLNINSSNYASNISNVLLANTNATYLKLDGSSKMTSGLNFNNLVQNKVISLYDQTPPNNFQFIGIGANNGLVLSLFATSDAFKFLVGTSATASSELMRITGTGNIGIGTNDPVSKLTINNIVSDRGTYDHSTSPLTITNQTATGLTINDPQPILNLCRQGSGGYSFGARATFKLCRYENSSTNSRTRMDIVLANNRYDEELSVMSIRSDGNVGIGTTSPSYMLDVYTDHASINNAIRIRANTAREASLILERSGTSWQIFNKGTGYGGAVNNLCFSSSSVSSILEITQSGNVGIGTTNPNTNLHIEHSSQTFNAGNGGLYVYNPNNVANHCSVLGARIAGTTANNVGVSLGIGTTGTSGWSILTTGIDTTNKLLRFNSSSDASGVDRLQIKGTDGYAYLYGSMTVGSATNGAVLTIGNANNATTLYLTDAGNAQWKVISGTTLSFQNDTPTGGTFANKMTLTNTGNLTTTYGNFNNVITSNNTGLGDPVNGFIGGSGDRIILWPGNATTTPFSLGINTNTLWISSPTNIKFFNNKIQTITIGSTGQVGIGSNVYQLLFDPPTASTAGTIQAIEQGVGYNRNLTLQALGGNVGIGTNNPTAKLHIEHSSTSISPASSGLYVFNPTNASTNSSMICARIGGNLANKALYALDVNNAYGWCMYINGNDTTNKTLRFNASWDALLPANDKLTIRSDGYTTINGQLQVSVATSNDVVSINLKNNSTYNGYIGIGCTGYSGNYINNLYIQSPQSFIINTNGNGTSATPNMIINTSGNVGIGTTNPGNILQVGSAGRLRISNGPADYSLIGTLDTDTATNTRIVISGNTRGFTFAGNIDYVATSTGAHLFYTTDSTTERMRINSTGNVGIGNPTPIGMLSIGRPDATSDGTLTISKNSGSYRNFKMGYDANFNFCFGDFYNTTTIANNPWTSNQLTINYGSGNIGIGTVGSAFKLAVNGSVNIFPSVGTDPISILFKGTDYNIGIAGTAGNYSLAAVTGDMIIRTLGTTNLLLQSGANGYALKIDTSNNVNVSNNLSVNGVISGNGSNITEINYNNITSNLLKLENQSVIRYPPTVMTGATTRFSSASYANNGTYTASASTNTVNAWYCFDAALPISSFNNTWSPATALYRSTAPFDYTSTASFTIINGITTVYGEWVQLYYDRGFVATNIVIWNNVGNSNPLPSSFILVGSIDGNYWTLLSQQSGIVSYSDPNSTNSYNINNYTKYNYYRLIVTNTIGSSSLTITELIINGLPNSTYVNTDNFNQIIYNTTEKQFPPRVYDIASAETTYTPSTGNELFGVVPSTVYKQTLTLNNHGIYTIYSSTTDGTYLKSLLFNFSLDQANGAHWAGAPQQYTSGNYSANTSYIKSDFKGDWLIVKYPYKIVLTKFKFYSRSGLIERAPGSWKCYGSNDGINFTEITEASNYQIPLTTNNYVLGYYEQLISSIFDIPYLYIGWVFNKLAAGTTSLLNFIELLVYGKDDISNSYSKTLSISANNSLFYNNISTITTYLATATSIDLTNKYVRFNYQDEVYINSGTYNLTFTGGSNSINTSPVITKYTYPILKDSSLNIINPLIWYKFDTSPGILIDSGSLNNGSLTTNGTINIDTTNYIHGNGSAYFTAVTTYYKVPNTIDLNAINLATGISFNLWVNITAAGNYGRIFDFGTTSGTNGTNYIMISREGNINNNLKFEIFGTTTGINYVTAGTNYINTGWYNICWTITTTGVWAIYINGTQLTLASQTSVIPSIPVVVNRTYYIGKSLFSGDGFLTMYLDDFRIYGKVLSQTEVIELYLGRVEVYTKNNIGIGTTNPNINSILDVNGNTNISGNVGIGTTNPRCTLEVGGIACIHNGAPYAIANNFMQTGSLTIGGLTSNYGGGSGWNTNTAGLLMECYDNTEIAVHDGGNRVSSLMYYEGGVATNRITIGRDMGGWGAITAVAINGRVGIGNASPKLNLDVGSTNANHSIGRAILTTNALNIHAPDKLDFLSIGRWDGSSTADWQFTGIKYGVITAVDAGETANNHSCITFHTWGNSISNTREVMRLTSRGNLNIGYLTNYSVNTKLNIKASSYGYSQPLVRIEQTAGWDGNYCLQTVGYTDLGGIRINGGDLGNSIFKTAATGDMGLTVNNGNMLFNVNGAERMRINNDGGVNINNYLNCAGLLTCSGSSTSATSNYRYFNAGTVLTYANTYQVDVCAKFNGSIWVTSWIASSSDTRIKKNIQDINDNSALVKILTIEPKTYEYIDNINKGTSTVYGFIAQQIKEVIPEAVKIENSIIPNIYKLCDCNDDIITIENNILEIDDKITIISINNDKELKENYKIIEKIPELNQIRIDKNLVGSNCFVYGTEVNDFHTLNKDYIFTLNVCATQELHRLIEQQQQQITDLMRRIEILESK